MVPIVPPTRERCRLRALEGTGQWFRRSKQIASRRAQKSDLGLGHAIESHSSCPKVSGELCVSDLVCLSLTPPPPRDLPENTGHTASTREWGSGAR